MSENMSNNFNNLFYAWAESRKGKDQSPLEHILALWARSVNAATIHGRPHCDFHRYCLALNIPQAPFHEWLEAKRGSCEPSPCLPEGMSYWEYTGTFPEGAKNNADTQMESILGWLGRAINSGRKAQAKNARWQACPECGEEYLDNGDPEIICGACGTRLVSNPSEPEPPTQH